MLNKPAVLLVEKAGGKVDTTAGELGEIYAEARRLRNETNDTGNKDSIFRIMVLSARGARAEYKFKAAIRSAPVVQEPDESESDPDAKEIRAKLKALGVNVPPRISLEKLLDLAIANGVEV